MYVFLAKTKIKGLVRTPYFFLFLIRYLRINPISTIHTITSANMTMNPAPPNATANTTIAARINAMINNIANNTINIIPFHIIACFSREKRRGLGIGPCPLATHYVGLTGKLLVSTEYQCQDTSDRRSDQADDPNDRLRNKLHNFFHVNYPFQFFGVSIKVFVFLAN